MSNTIHTREEIQTRAYQFWQERGCPWGTPEKDWFAAEQELNEPDTLMHVARDVGSLVGGAVSFLREITSAVIH